MKPPRLSDRIEALALGARDQMVEWVCQPEVILETQDALRARLRMGTRDGVRNVLDLLGLLHEDSGVQKAIEDLVQQLGAANTAEARRHISTGQAIEQLTDADKYALCERYILEAWDKDPALRTHSPLLSGAMLEPHQNGVPK